MHARRYPGPVIDTHGVWQGSSQTNLNFVNVISQPYTKRMNLRGDMSSWSAYQVSNVHPHAPAPVPSLHMLVLA